MKRMLMAVSMIALLVPMTPGQATLHKKPGGFKVNTPRSVQRKLALALGSGSITLEEASTLWTSAESAYTHHQDNTLLFDRYGAGEMALKQLRKKLAPTYRPQVDDFCYEGWVQVGTNYWDFGSFILIATYWYCEETGLHITCLEISNSGNPQCGSPY